MYRLLGLTLLITEGELILTVGLLAGNSLLLSQYYIKTRESFCQKIDKKFSNHSALLPASQ